jgi:hypothetical protein
LPDLRHGVARGRARSRGKLAIPADHAEARERASYVSTLWAADRDGGSW